MDMSLVQRQKLKEYIDTGSVVALQQFISNCTDGFRRLFAIANGEEVDGVRPTVSEQLKAMGMLLDKGFPSLKATHVMSEHRRVPSVQEEMDMSDIMKQLEELNVEAQKISNGTH